MSKKILALNAKLEALKANGHFIDQINQSLEQRALELKEVRRLEEERKAKLSR